MGYDRPMLNVRPAQPADIAFLADCNMAMARETEDKSLDRNVLEHGIAAVFTQPSRGFYLIAERDSIAVGSLLVTYEWSDWRNGNWWWIQSVYVVPDARRAGVFRALHVEVAQQAHATPDVIGLRLYVEQHNERAQATYRGLGMQRTHYQLFEDEFAQTRD